MADGRYSEAFVTADSGQVIYVDGPLSYIMPPTIEVHHSGVGPVTFYFASCYGLPIPRRKRKRRSVKPPIVGTEQGDYS